MPEGLEDLLPGAPTQTSYTPLVIRDTSIEFLFRVKYYSLIEFDIKEVPERRFKLFEYLWTCTNLCVQNVSSAMGGSV